LANEIYDYPLGNMQYRQTENMAESTTCQENAGMPGIRYSARTYPSLRKEPQ